MMRAWATALALAVALPTAAQADTALIEAIRDRDQDAARDLIGEADVNAPEADGSTALLWAAHFEDVDLVRRLLRAGADPNVANDYGVMPLQEAANSGNAAVIELLLDAGADVESANPEGQTALMAAARTGRLEAARLLIEAGADVNARENWGEQTALMWAAAQGQPEMIELLIEAGADPDARAAARDWERRLTSEPRVKEMLTGGLTALLYAAREGCDACARALVDNGADIDMADPDGVTPLVLSLLNFHFDTAEYLIEAGADVNKWDWWGRTPLYAAADVNIIPQGARADLPSLDRTTGLEIAGMLLARGADPNLRLKLSPPPRNIVYDRGADAGVLNTGATPLIRAAYGGDLEMMELLLNNGARIDIPTASGVTPVVAAAGPGGTRGSMKTEDTIRQALDLLIANGMDVDVAGRGGQTPLHVAARSDYREIVRYLVDKGADLAATDNRGFTALDHALGRADQLGFGANNNPREMPEMIALLTNLMQARGLDVPQEAIDQTAEYEASQAEAAEEDTAAAEDEADAG